MLFVKLCNFYFKILWELQLHISKITGEEPPCIKDFEDNWQRLLPYLCEEETPKGRYFLHLHVTDTLSSELLISVHVFYLCLDEMSGSAVKSISSFFSDCPSIVTVIDQVGADYSYISNNKLFHECVLDMRR